MLKLMPQSNGKPEFPLIKAAVSMTVMAVIILAVVWVLCASLQLASSTDFSAILIAGGLAWGICLISLVVINQLSLVSPSAVAYGQFLAGFSRIFIGVLAALILIHRLELPSKPIVFGLMVVYLPVMFMESYMVGKFVKHALDDPQNDNDVMPAGSSAVYTEQAS